MFTDELREISIVNKHYQVFAMARQIYIYKNWTELFDCLRTQNNEVGIFACASFKGDEERFMIATVSEKSRCSVQIRDYVFKKDLVIGSVFGEENEANYQFLIGDLAIDECGERLFIVNAESTLLKTYSLMDLRHD